MRRTGATLIRERGPGGSVRTSAVVVKYLVVVLLSFVGSRGWLVDLMTRLSHPMHELGEALRLVSA